MSYHRTKSGVHFCINNCSYPMENVRQLTLRRASSHPWQHSFLAHTVLSSHSHITGRSQEVACPVFHVQVHRQPCNISTSSFTRTQASQDARTRRTACVSNRKQGVKHYSQFCFLCPSLLMEQVVTAYFHQMIQIPLIYSTISYFPMYSSTPTSSCCSCRFLTLAQRQLKITFLTCIFVPN